MDPIQEEIRPRTVRPINPSFKVLTNFSYKPKLYGKIVTLHFLNTLYTDLVIQEFKNPSV